MKQYLYVVAYYANSEDAKVKKASYQDCSLKAKNIEMAYSKGMTTLTGIRSDRVISEHVVEILTRFC